VPWQSVQVAAAALPALRDTLCDVPAYSFTALSWQFAHCTGCSLSPCGILSAAMPAWQSVHLSVTAPCTDCANFAPSTAMDLPAALFASVSP
jgi:hypothetical protein